MNASVNRRFYNYNFAEGQLQFSYLWPWFGLPGLTFRPAIAVAKTQYITFAADTLTASALWEKTLLSRPSLTGTFGYTVEKVNQFNEATVRDKGQLLIGSITPKLSLDFRDSPLSPTTGFFATSWFDLAYPFFGSESDIGFYRAQFRADYHLPLWKKISWYFSFRTGFEQNVAPSGNAIPLIKQFALGGIGSLRGYQEQQLNAQTLSITGSLSYVNYRAQLDLPFAGELKFGLFADAANLKQDSFSFGDLLYGLGFGFHYQTPVGPVNLDWGFKTAPKAGEDPYVIHFSVGII